MTLLGYSITLGYVFFLILIIGGLVSKVSSVEVSRKIIHILLFGVWILIRFFFRNTIHQIVIPVIFLIVNTLSYRFRIFRSIEREDNNHWGTIFFAAAITLVMTVVYFFPAYFEAAGASIACLTFGDGFAALGGQAITSYRIRDHKTIAGFISCFVASTVALLIFMKTVGGELNVIDVILLSLIAAIAELTEKGLDNFTVTFAVFGFALLLQKNISSDLRFSIAMACFVFIIVMFTKAITYGGSILSTGIVFSFCYFGGVKALIYLLLTYFTIFIVAIVRKKIHSEGLEKKHSSRTFLQILINGGIGTACIVFSAFIHGKLFTALAIIAIGGCFIDSVSSDIGSLASGEPYDPFRRKYVHKGLSGGMSILGTSSSLLFSVLISVYSLWILRLPTMVGILTGGFSFLQTIIDSAMGSLFQVKYKCVVCDKSTEKRTHCGFPTIYQSGIRLINNNIVNLLSSIFVTSLASVCLMRML